MLSTEGRYLATKSSTIDEKCEKRDDLYSAQAAEMRFSENGNNKSRVASVEACREATIAVTSVMKS